MKKQNVIILLIFILLILGFYVATYFVNQNNFKTINVEINDIDEKQYFECYVFGEVYRCDVYKIPSTWTIGMLFDLAGLKSSADISNFDLLLLVEDNKNYYIPSKKLVDETTIVNINTATLEELTKLPSIGEVIALRIIEYRQKNPFKNKEEIKNVKGVGDAIYEKIKDYITV